MNENDRLVLRELIKNGRKEISEIADDVGLSRQTVSKKVQKLQEEGVIRSFTVELDNEKIGLDERAYIIVTADPDTKLRKKFMEEARKLKEVRHIHYLFGRFDIILEVIKTDEEKLDELIEKIHGFEAVKGTETLVCRETVKKESKGPFLKALED